MEYKKSITLRAAFLLIGSTLVTGLIILGCAKPPKKVSDDLESEEEVPSKFLYVASGACYSGTGNTTFTNTTSSNLVFRVNPETGARYDIIADYNSSPAVAGDTPVGIANVDSDNIYVLVENTTTVGARRIEKVPKTVNASRTAFSNNILALSAQLRSLLRLPNGDMLISKSTAIEKITAANVRITQGANPFINAPAAPCATSTTLHTKVVTLGNGNVVFLHATAAQNRFGVISASGYAAAGNCLAAQAAPVATAFPVAAVYDAVNTKLIVAYAGITTGDNVNSIYAYTINESTGAISSPQEIYDATNYPSTYPYLLYGISDMYLDTTDNKLYVATAISTTTAIVNYAIEKFSYDASKIGTANAEVLTRAGTTPFYPYGVDTKCISSMFIAE